jgi:hypothetical protein
VTAALAADARPRTRTALDRCWPLVPTGLATALALLAIGMRWRGSDLPAHFFRVALVERDGFQVWNNQWFGGHHTIGYGPLFPVLGAALGIWTMAVVGAAAGAFLADLLLTRTTGRRCVAASLWFAAGTLTNVAIGRLPFALGLAIGIGALVAVHGRRPVLAVVLALATAAASPVVSSFLAIVLAAWGWVSPHRERVRLWALAGVSVAPVLVLAVLYPQGGTFPFRWQALVWSLVACGLMLVLVPDRYRLVRTTTVLYGLAAIGVFLVPSPLGANLTRFGMYAAAPALLAVGVRRRLLVATLPALLFWQWSPALDAILRSRSDPSVERSYYAPLLGHLAAVGAEEGRIEIVPTARHWETAYVAARYPIARGWERQLDIRFNELFYDDELTPLEYYAWLREQGVDRVALADAPLDDAGKREAELIESGLPYLRPVWSDRHWRVWEVVGATGLVDGPAEVVEMDAGTVVLDVRVRGDVTLRVRESAFWRSDPPVCIEPTEDGWVVLRDAPVGRIEVVLDGGELLPSGEDDPCADR